MKTIIEKNGNDRITVKNIRVEGVYNNNEFVAIPDKMFDLKNKINRLEGEVCYLHFRTNKNLAKGDIISIKDIDFSDVEKNKIENGRLEIDGEFGGIDMEQKADKKQVNQNEVLSWINDNFSLQIDNEGNFINSGDGDIVHQNEVKNLDEIFQVIENYIKNHPRQFKLGKFVSENYNAGLSRS